VAVKAFYVKGFKGFLMLPVGIKFSDRFYQTRFFIEVSELKLSPQR